MSLSTGLPRSNATCMGKRLFAQESREIRAISHVMYNLLYNRIAYMVSCITVTSPLRLLRVLIGPNLWCLYLYLE